MASVRSRLLSEEAHELRDVIRDFVESEMSRAHAARWDVEDTFPANVFEKLATLGVMGLAIPEEYGGVGRDIPATLMVIEELSKRSLAVAIPYIMASCYAGMTVAECGTEEQKRHLLPEIAEGRILFAYGWTEPDVGADLASVKTTIRRDGDELVINGAKRFCTGAEISDFIYTLGRSGPENDRYRNLSAVFVPTDTQGVSITRLGAMGLKGAQTTDVSFTDVRVPIENLMGGEEAWNDGWRLITGSGLDIEKLEVAAMSLGIATAAYEDALAYTKERRQFGVLIGQHQSIAHALADMKVKLHASRLMLEDAASLANENISCGVETSMAKLFVTEAAKEVVLSAQTIMGAYGYSTEFDCERYVRDILAMPIIGGSSAIQRNNIYRWSLRDR